MCVKLFLLLSFLFHSLHRIYGVEEFLALQQWVNSLDSRQKVEDFVHSNAAFAREVVVIFAEEGQQKQAYLGHEKYPLVQGLERVNKNRKDHQLMLVFNSVADFKDSVHALTLIQHKWIWLNFPIQSGPGSNQTPLNLVEFTDSEVRLMRSFQVSFGFTVADKNFGSGEYTKLELEELANKTDVWFSRLAYRSNFIVEISMHILLNTTDHARAMRPFYDRTMFISFVTTSRYEDFNMEHKGPMKALAKILGKERLYMNIPENQRLLLNPVSWFTSGLSSGWINRPPKGILIIGIVCIISKLISRDYK